MNQKIILEIQSKLQELRIRAKEVNYVDKIPVIPVFKKNHPYAHESQLRGFNRRLYHWVDCLEKLEFINEKPDPEAEKDNLVEIELQNGIKLIREDGVQSN